MAAEMIEDNCSICLDSASSNCDRTVVRLRCSHVFHLDCIGSAFNASGVMQCPNCRQYENGAWLRFPKSNIEENNDETVDEEEDDDDDEEEEVQQFNPRPRYEYRLSIVHDRIRRILTHRHQDTDNHRFEPLTPTEASPSHVIRHCFPLPLEAELSTEFSGICGNTTRANHPTIASTDSAQHEANREPVGHLFDLDQGGGNDPVFQRTQPFSNSSPAPMIASMTVGSTSNGDVLVDSSISLSRSGRNGYDYCDFLFAQPSSSSLSPTPAAALASMASRNIREFTARFRGNGAHGLRVAHVGFPSSSEQTKDVFHAASSSETLFHGRHTVSTSEPTRNLINVATSQNEPQATIHSPHTLEEIKDIATFEYLLDEMDPSSMSHE